MKNRSREPFKGSINVGRIFLRGRNYRSLLVIRVFHRVSATFKRSNSIISGWYYWQLPCFLLLLNKPTKWSGRTWRCFFSHYKKKISQEITTRRMVWDFILKLKRKQIFKFVSSKKIIVFSKHLMIASKKRHKFILWLCTFHPFWRLFYVPSQNRLWLEDTQRGRKSSVFSLQYQTGRRAPVKSNAFADNGWALSTADEQVARIYAVLVKPVWIDTSTAVNVSARAMPLTMQSAAFSTAR